MAKDDKDLLKTALRHPKSIELGGSIIGNLIKLIMLVIIFFVLFSFAKNNPWVWFFGIFIAIIYFLRR